MGRKNTAGPDFWPYRDRELYVDGARSGSRRSGRRLYGRLSPRTHYGIEVDYGVCLRWLQENKSLDPEAMPADRWSIDLVEEMGVDMIVDGYSVASVHSRIRRLKRALGVMQPAADLAYFDAVLREFDRPKARFDDIVWKVNSADVQNYGIALMDLATERRESDPIGAASLYCSSLQIALIAARPWRKRAFTLMELYVNLVKGTNSWRMIAHAHETKHRHYQSGLVPAKLVPNVETYIDIHRMVLCRLSGYKGPALWLNKEGLPMTPAQFFKSFTHLTKQKFGVPITVQAVRKIAATTMALHNPAEVHNVSGVLGHSRYRTSEDHYIMTGSFMAHEDLDATFDKLTRAANDRRRLSRRRQKSTETR